MSKSRVFIVWNDKDIANKVSEKLKIYQYEGIVGGSDRAEGGRTIIDTVINEMDQCDQAIVIMKKKGTETQISANVYLELGYAISKYGSMRTHLYFIDYDYKDVPSDLSGVWVDDTLKTYEIKPTFAPTDWSVFKQIDKMVDTLVAEKNMRKAVKDGYKNELWRERNNDEIAESIVNSFTAHQKSVIREDKIKVLANYYHYRNYVIDHMKSPHCSDYELAQYIIFLTQGAYMHDDLDDFKHYLEALHVNGRMSPELNIAVKYALMSVKVFQEAMPCDYVNLSSGNAEGYVVNTTRLLDQLLSLYSIYTVNDSIRDSSNKYYCFHIDKKIYKNARCEFEDIRAKVEDNLAAKIRKFVEKKDSLLTERVTIMRYENSLGLIKSYYPENVYDDFWLWMYASVFEMEQYLDILYLFSMSEENEPQSVFDLFEKTAKSCVQITNILYDETLEIEDKNKVHHDQNEHNKYFAKLYQAYIYRNLYEASKFGSKSGNSTESENTYLKKALYLRQELLLFCKNNTVTDMFEKQMEMEYSLALSRALDSVNPRPLFELDGFYNYFNSTVINLLKKGQYVGGLVRILKSIQIQENEEETT